MCFCTEVDVTPVQNTHAVCILHQQHRRGEVKACRVDN